MRGCQGSGERVDLVLEVVLQALTVRSRLTAQCLGPGSLEARVTLPFQLTPSSRSLGLIQSPRNLLNWSVSVSRRRGYVNWANDFLKNVGRAVPEMKPLMKRFRELNSYLATKRVSTTDIINCACATEALLARFEQAMKPYFALYDGARLQVMDRLPAMPSREERTMKVRVRQAKFLQLVKDNITGPNKDYVLSRLEQPLHRRRTKGGKCTGSKTNLRDVRSEIRDLWIQLHMAVEKCFTFAVPCTALDHDELLDWEMRHLNVSGTREEHVEIRPKIRPKSRNSSSSSDCSCEGCMALCRNRLGRSFTFFGSHPTQCHELIEFKAFESVNEETLLKNRLKILNQLSRAESQRHAAQQSIMSLCEVFQCMDELQTYDPQSLWQFTVGYNERKSTRLPVCDSKDLNKLWSGAWKSLDQFIAGRERLARANPKNPTESARDWYRLITAQRVLRWTQIILKGSSLAKRKRQWEIHLPPGDLIMEDTGKKVAKSTKQNSWWKDCFGFLSKDKKNKNREKPNNNLAVGLTLFPTDHQIRFGFGKL
ncbi:hypothetical protein GNI_113500 [Gregarina niphandrodes]|uniref:Uncharacterized protein n=1 Tax=Gregarina niphandrodes TaxID=110365 RepID=A0A023B388_GRENI|nr:hypothetical protein GNI_113500 [Gregarina niphandrodes]EZG55408.1 hypothetical protein GNI_113500 [Gregarina niphandrodes]|eukprot:XP_011131582.1 hypothetical protein GNI_113500 [Gregarina niphandrodes]